MLLSFIGSRQLAACKHELQQTSSAFVLSYLVFPNCSLGTTHMAINSWNSSLHAYGMKTCKISQQDLQSERTTAFSVLQVKILKY
jgi:hypothetical protein